MNEMIKEIVDQIVEDMEIFLKDNPDLEFYALAFDCNSEYAGFIVSANTQEEYEKILHSYQERYPKLYYTEFYINELKYSVGDWEYLDISEINLFSEEELIEKYQDDLDKQCEEIMSMCEMILKEFRKTETFDKIPKTKDFVSFCIDHDEPFEDALARQGINKKFK